MFWGPPSTRSAYLLARRGHFISGRAAVFTELAPLGATTLIKLLTLSTGAPCAPFVHARVHTLLVQLPPTSFVSVHGAASAFPPSFPPSYTRATLPLYEALTFVS